MKSSGVVTSKSGNKDTNSLELNRKVSYGIGAYEPKPITKSVKQIVRKLSSKGLKTETGKIRKELEVNGKSERYKKLKNRSQSAWWAVILKGGTDESCITEFTGLLFIDLDEDVTPEKIERFKKDPHVYHLRQSTSGSGYHALFQIPIVDSMEGYKGHWRAVKVYLSDNYGLTIDNQTSNPNRCAYLSYTAEPYFNLDSQVFTDVELLPEGIGAPAHPDDVKSYSTPDANLEGIVETIRKHPEVLKDREKWRNIMYGIDDEYGPNARGYMMTITEIGNMEHGYNDTWEDVEKLFSESRNGSVVTLGTVMHILKDYESEAAEPPENFSMGGKSGIFKQNEDGSIEEGDEFDDIDFGGDTMEEQTNAATNAEELKALFDTFWSTEEFCIMAGPNGTGKSILAIDIAWGIATGKSWAGFKVEAPPTPVLYIDLEMGEGMMRGRLTEDGERQYQFPKNLYRITKIRTSEKYPDRLSALTHLMKGYMIKRGVKVFIIDNLTAIEAGAEDGKVAGEMLTKIGEFKRDNKLAILLLTHIVKTKDGTPLEQNQVRGSGVIANLVDSMFGMGKDLRDNSKAYLIELKARNREYQHLSDNVVSMKRHRKYGRLSMAFSGYADEGDMLNNAKEYAAKNEVKPEDIVAYLYRQDENFNRSEAARVIGISRDKLKRILKKLEK